LKGVYVNNSVRLDRDDPERDKEEYRNHHLALFNHFPIPDESGKCQHPVHARIRREMNGAHFTIDFDPREIVSDDSFAQSVYDDAYQRKYKEAKAIIAEVDAEEKYDQARKLGLILPRSITCL
jgi:hypothetical protein